VTVSGAVAASGSAALFLGAGVMIILGSSIAAKVFTCYSHPLSSLPASGLRLETVIGTDKKISEVYFASSSKKILTRKLNRQFTGTSNESACA
jgi:hypothetical protein